MLRRTGFCCPLWRGWWGCRQLRQLHRGGGREDLAVTIVGAIGRAGYPGGGKAHADLVIGLRGLPETEPRGGTPEIIISQIVRVADLHHQDSELAPLTSLVQDQCRGAVRAPSVATRSAALERRFSGLKSPHQFVWRTSGGVVSQLAKTNALQPATHALRSNAPDAQFLNLVLSVVPTSLFPSDGHWLRRFGKPPLRLHRLARYRQAGRLRRCLPRWR